MPVRRPLASLAAAAVLSPLLALSLAAPAAADRPAAGCPPRFDALTLAEQIELGKSKGIEASSVEAAHDKYDKNRNDVLCVRVDKVEDGKGPVLVDDTSRS